MAAAVMVFLIDGSRRHTEAAVGLRDDDALASAAMASLADGGSSGGGHCRQLCSGG